MASRSENAVKDELTKISSKFVHPKSRKCIAMVRKVKKESKKEKSKQESKFKQSLVAEKLLWFQNQMDSNICPYTIELTAALVEKYIARNDEELEQINLKRSIGGNRNRQHTGREDAIRLTKERERGDYESCGLEIPDILNSSQCNMLKKWNGDLKYLPNFKFYHFCKKHVDEELQKRNRLVSEQKKPTENENISTSFLNDCKQEIIENKIISDVSNNSIELKTQSKNLQKKKQISSMKEKGETMDTE